jgi:MinD superfamily P-loop ATPase
MTEIVVISGKGGTGKTSLLASFASLAQDAVLADCDVDASDLHLLLAPEIRRREAFLGGHEAVIRAADCIGCGACLARCRFDAVIRSERPGSAAGAPCNDCPDGCARSCPVKHADMIQAYEATCGFAPEPSFAIDPAACEGCGVCVDQCPVHAIDFPERISGEWYVSDTRHGPLVHARLNPGGENSGKLVSTVRNASRALAAERKAGLILTDGPPGTGCAVIASVTGASKVLVVTEPTLSGSHDMDRVLQLTRHFGLPTFVCINKCDLNGEMAARIESAAHAAGAKVAGRVRYDRSVTQAQLRGLSAIEAGPGPLADDIRAVWRSVAP